MEHNGRLTVSFGASVREEHCTFESTDDVFCEPEKISGRLTVEFFLDNMPMLGNSMKGSLNFSKDLSLQFSAVVKALICFEQFEFLVQDLGY